METLTTVLGIVKSVGTTMFEIAGDGVQFLLDNPICLIPLGMFVVYAAVGLGKSFVKGA